LGVAGAFTVDGRGGAFVTAIEGDYHNVVGISLPLLRDLVHRLGLSWTGLWRRPISPSGTDGPRQGTTTPRAATNR
jgi:septum formation protein